MNAITNLSNIKDFKSDWDGGGKSSGIQEPPVLMRTLVRGFFQITGRIAPAFAAKKAFGFFGTPLVRAKHKRSDALLDSAERAYIQNGNQRLQTYKWGTGSKKLLLLHGWQSRGTALRAFIPSLLDKDFTVYAFDAPAHGESDGNFCTVRLYGEAIASFTKVHTDIDYVISHSLGGAACMYYMAFVNPTVSLKKLVMLAAPESIVKVIKDAGAQMALPPAAFKKFEELCIAHGNGRRLEEYSLARNYRNLSIGEAILFHDKDDAITKVDEVKNIVHGWDRATLYMTEGYGHYRIVKNPDVIQKIADFMD